MSLSSFTLPFSDSLFQKIEPATPLTSNFFYKILSLAAFGGCANNRALVTFPANTYLTNTSSSTVYWEGWNPIFCPLDTFLSSCSGGNTSYYYCATYPGNMTFNTTSNPNNFLSGQYPSQTAGACVNNRRWYHTFFYSFFASRARVQNGQTVKIRQMGCSNSIIPSIYDTNPLPTDNPSNFLENVITGCLTHNPTAISVPVALEILKQKRPWIPILFLTTISTFYTTSYSSTVNQTVSSAGGTIRVYHNNTQTYGSTRQTLGLRSAQTVMVPWFRGVESSYGSEIYIGLTTPSVLGVVFPNNKVSITFGSEFFTLPVTIELNSTRSQVVTTRYVVARVDLSPYLDQIFSQTEKFFDGKNYLKITFPDFGQYQINSLSVWRR